MSADGLRNLMMQKVKLCACWCFCLSKSDLCVHSVVLICTVQQCCHVHLTYIPECSQQTVFELNISFCDSVDNNNKYYIDGRIYLDLSKSIQSTTGRKALKLAASERYLMWKSSPYYLFFTVQKYIYPYVTLNHWTCETLATLKESNRHCNILHCITATWCNFL